MNACGFRARIGPYYDGEVAAEERRRIELHLAACAACRQELAELSQLSAQLAAAGPGWSAEAQDRLHGRLEAQFQRAPLRTARAMLALAACLLLACTLWVWQARPADAAAAPWETLAANPQPDSGGSNSPQVATAKWIVQDLSGAGPSGGGQDGQ
jgi:anti-sigma factor RsiW